MSGGGIVPGPGGGGGATLPAAPAAVLLDAGAPSTIVGLNSSGVGTALSASASRAAMDAMQDVLTTRGDLVRAGVAGIAERLPAATADTFLGGDGTDVTTRTAAQVLASLGLLWTPSLASSAGWTDVSSGVGSVAITGGALTGTITTGSNNVAAATIPWGGADCFDVRGRVQITGDTTANGQAHLRARYGSDGFLLIAGGAGSLSLVRTLGSYSSLASTAGRPVDGTGWVRLRIVGQRVTMWYGTGSGSSQPTSWTLLYDADQAALLAVAGPTALHLGAQNGSALSVTTDFAWRSVTVQSIGGAL